MADDDGTESNLAERMSMVRRLGVGGYGVVHEVADKRLGRTLALKTLHGDQIQDAAAQARLREEARTTARLDHPGIVPVHELGTDSDGAVLPSGSLYFTMKKVEGQTLADFLEDSKDAGPQTTKSLFERLQVLLKVCDAVSFAHSRGVVHRDIKPGNIMVGRYGQVHLMDWGVAKVDGIESDEHLVGTLPYMSPEQARADHAKTDERSDVFSLGAVLYEMLAGRPPYEHATGSAEGLRFQAMVCNVLDVRKAADWSLPNRLADITMKALTKNPDGRYASVLAFQEEIEAFMRSGWQFPRRTYAPGQAIVRENEPGHAAYVIVRGRCVAYKTVDGQRVALREMGEGDVFGETAVFAQQPRTASVEAIEATTVMEITKEFFLEDEGVGYWLGRFVRALAERFSERDARATELERQLNGRP